MVDNITSHFYEVVCGLSKSGSVLEKRSPKGELIYSVHLKCGDGRSKMLCFISKEEFELLCAVGLEFVSRSIINDDIVERYEFKSIVNYEILFKVFFQETEKLKSYIKNIEHNETRSEKKGRSKRIFYL